MPVHYHSGAVTDLKTIDVWGILHQRQCMTCLQIIPHVHSLTLWSIFSPLTDCLDSLNHRRNVAFLSIFYCYFYVDCSSELANCMPTSLPRPCCTRLSTSFHPYSVHLPNERVNQYLHSFIPHTGKLWNSLPLSVFPSVYDLNSFKRGVSRHLSH